LATGAVLPTGSIRDTIDGIEVTCVDNGMPVVVARAGDLGITGYEPAGELAGDTGLRGRVQSLRLAAGKLMGLGDVSETSVPKTTLVSAPRDGGTICTRTFIPVHPHTAGAMTGHIREDQQRAG
jgi:4-oxalomesaconate tautomerase